MTHFVREDTRYPVELAVRVRCSSWSDYLDLYTTNLSRGGVFVASQISAPIGTEVVVTLSLPNNTSVELRAEVVHLTDDASRAEGDPRPPGMGLMFVEMEEETRKALEAMVTVARFTTRTGAPPPSMKPHAPVAPPPSPPAATVAPSAPPAVPKAAVPPPRPPAPPSADAAPPPPPVDKSRAPMFGDVVEQSLFNELARRDELSPHDQLGIEANARDEEIDAAYQRLCERYETVIFKRYGPATQEVVRKINELLLAAHTTLFDPQKRAALSTAPPAVKPEGPTPDENETRARGEEARRALKASIERRVEDACRHRDLEELEEAIRGFEAVLALDRKHDYAREQLRLLRDKRAHKDSPKPHSLFDRLLKR